MRRLASRPLPQARFACARLPRWPASAPSSVACLSTDSSSPKGAAASGFLDKGRGRTAPDRASFMSRMREADAGLTHPDAPSESRMRESGASQLSDEPPTMPPAASLTTTQIANTLRGYARRQERPVVALQALAVELPRRSNWPSNPSPTLTLARP